MSSFYGFEVTMEDLYNPSSATQAFADRIRYNNQSVSYEGCD